jgi:hypothetical protein
MADWLSLTFFNPFNIPALLYNFFVLTPLIFVYLKMLERLTERINELNLKIKVFEFISKKPIAEWSEAETDEFGDKVEARRRLNILSDEKNLLLNQQTIILENERGSIQH